MLYVVVIIMFLGVIRKYYSFSNCAQKKGKGKGGFFFSISRDIIKRRGGFGFRLLHKHIHHAHRERQRGVRNEKKKNIRVFGFEINSR